MKKNLFVDEICLNEGQIEGLPKNPRFIKGENFEKLKKSISDNPEMLDLRPLMVYPFEGKFIVIGGNMRFRACKDLGYKELPCEVLNEDTPVENLRAYMLKDNGAFGEWDFDELANEFDTEELEAICLELPTKTATEELSELEYHPVYYEPENKPQIKLSDCIDTEKFDKKVAFINSLNLDEEKKAVLKMFCYRFLKIDFESVANYYYFNASEEEKEAIERLRLVLVDSGADGFIEDDLLKVLSVCENDD